MLSTVTLAPPPATTPARITTALQEGAPIIDVLPALRLKSHDSVLDARPQAGSGPR